MSSLTVGRVAALWRYPVKSMAAEPMSTVDVAWHGVAGDRRWAFIRPGLERSGFPWLTIRERNDLGHYRPELVEPDRPDASPVRVRTPGGEVFDVLDPALAAEFGPGVRVIKQNRGVFDAFPLSLISSQTVAALGTLVGEPLDVRRFRPNLVVEAAGDAPYQEDGWVGSVLRIGTLRMRVDRRDKRCAITNVDPQSARRDPAVLRAIAAARDAQTGVYGSVVTPGTATVGDPVVIE